MNAARELRVLSYDPDKPSYRYRIAPLLDELARRGWRSSVDVLPQRRYGLRIWERRTALREPAVLLLHKLRLAPLEMRWLVRLNPLTLFDIDDATWLSQPAGDAAPRASRSRRQAFAAACRLATRTLAGNAYLAERAAAEGARVERVPTAVDTSIYPAPDFARRAGATAVWIGLPANLQYLEPLRPAFAALARRHPRFRLRIVSSRFPDWDEVPLERVEWRPGIESGEALAGADIGLMPLADDAFTRGKCAFKLLQYMAASLPCVASPVGANREVVVDGTTGCLAASVGDWERALERLLGDAAARESMGRAGRARVEQGWDLATVIAREADLVERLAAARGRDRPGATPGLC